MRLMEAREDSLAIYEEGPTLADAGVVLVPVPFDGTVSYGVGASRGPAAIAAASFQVDLFDLEVGRPDAAGILMRAIPEDLLGLAEEVRELAAGIYAAGGAGEDRELRAKLGVINALCERVNRWVYDEARRWREAGRIVGTVGGDHGSVFGSIQAAAEAHPGLGVLHVDAHADLREAYMGMTWSHASIMHNVMTRLPQVSRLVQVGIRDFCEEEHSFIAGSEGRIVTFFDQPLAHARLGGETWLAQVGRIVEALPREVYISFDIDGLDPALCPHTGTPVPGGLSFHQATSLLRAVAESGRRIVGFDLNEVAPGDDGSEWDANVGARLLYKLIGWAIKAR